MYIKRILKKSLILLLVPSKCLPSVGTCTNIKNVWYFHRKTSSNSVTFYRASITLTSCERTVIYYVMFFAVIFISWNAVKILLYVLVISNLLFPDTQIINLSHSTDDHCCRIAKVSSCKSRNCQQPIKLCETLISQHRVQCQILPTHFA